MTNCGKNGTKCRFFEMKLLSSKSKFCKMLSFSKIKPTWIIHIFALMHAAVALSCRAAGIEDELLLTLLTMAMVLLMCFRKSLSIEFTAAIIIVANIVGYLLGTVGAYIFEQLISHQYTTHALSTAVTTEFIGWCVLGLSKLFPKMGSASGNKLTSASLKWTLLAAGGIFFLRLTILFVSSQYALETDALEVLTSKVLSNSIGMIVLICLNVLYIRHQRGRHQDLSTPMRVVLGCLFMIGCALLETLLAGSGFPFSLEADFFNDFPLLLLISLLTQITIYCLVYIVIYAISAKNQMNMEREKANMAQYRYLKLKRQVNPHFLFNSLNILDCLVCEEKTDLASTYIHKLAGIYRYMIKSEDEEIVPLRDELMFVNQYVDLLRLRFPEGFKVNITVPEDAMSSYVLPCSVQLLIENATKHNAVSADNPLIINVCVDNNHVKVSNNIIPKVTKSESTGLGQKYIRQQYIDLSGKTIKICNDGEEYCVTLPLL